jgi:tetratricopeptide (TPR) repeat protein
VKPGDIVDDRFELDQLTGSGGMGEVFRARDRASGATVAVKVLLDERTPESARFAREAQVLADLRHPRIVQYVAHGATPSGEPYLVMEWLEGEHLLSRLLRGRLSVPESVSLATYVAEALAAAHARGIVHRDLKPSNLFLQSGKFDRVKLLDFGIAHLCNVTRMTQTGILLGTPGYMAPEQARSGQAIDARADVFALGCVLFECLTGAPAFKGDHFMAVLAKILFEEAPLLREIRPQVPGDLAALVARMLAKDPNERPRDGEAVVLLLAELGKQSGLLDAPPSSVHPLALTRGERRALSVVLIGRTHPAVTADADTLTSGEVPPIEDALRKEAEAGGGRLEHLADGSSVVTIARARMATDQAALAARCALALRKHAGSRRMALATGYGVVTGRMPVGDAIDRAAAMLARQAAPAGAQPPRALPGGAPSPRILLWGAQWPRAPLAGDDLTPIAIDKVTAGLLDARFEVRETDNGLLLHGERELAEAARTLLGKPTVCVGRDWELGALAQIFTECVEDSVARAVLVTAPAGMGKSRVAHELMHRIRQRDEGVAVWIGRGDSLRAGSPFGLLGQALRGACGIREGEPLSVRRQKLVARAAEHVSSTIARRVAEFLGELVGTPLSDEDSISLRAARKDAQLMGDQMRQAFEDFLAAEGAAHPVLLVLEDLHWGDLPTVRFIDGALRAVKNRPWMALALARPEVHDLFPRVWADRGVQEIRLKELTRKASERLVRQVLGNDVDPETIERLAAQADGNAFYLEELIRATAERKGEELPRTVVAMVQSRLGGLDSEARRVLRAASVFGEVFWPGGVTALVGGGRHPPPVGELIAELVEREVLVRRPESRFPGEEELAFRHALLREGAHAMLTEEDRALGHRLAGEWLLGHGEGDPLVLAEHFERGKEPARAGSFYLRAVEQAHQGGDTDTSIARARRALECGVPGNLRIALLGMLCVAHVYRPDSLGAVAPEIEEVMRVAAPGSAPWAQAASAKLVGAVHLDKHEEFMVTLERVKEVEPSPDAIFPITLALINGILVLDAWGQLNDAEAIFQRCHAIVDSLAAREPIAAGLLGTIHGLRDAYAHEDPWAGLQQARVAKALFREANHHRGAAISQAYLGMNLWFLGALAQAKRELVSVASADDEIGVVLRSHSLIGVLSDQGALEEAHELSDQIVKSASARRHRMHEGRGRWALAEVLRREGHVDAAEREARAALELLATVPLDQIAATATLAAILLAKGRAGEALVATRGAMQQVASIRACGFFRGAFLRLVHAEALSAAGDHEAARTAIGEGRARLFTNADKIGDPALRQSFLEDVPENARTLELARGWLPERGQGA